MKILYLGAALLASVPIASIAPSGYRQEPDPKAVLETKVRKLLELTNASAMGEQVMQSMIQSFRQMPGLPPDFLDEFQRKVDPDELIELIVPIYVEHLDGPTLDGAIAFFESAAGKKYVQAQPAIMQESMQVGMKWGQDVAREVLESSGKDD